MKKIYGILGLVGAVLWGAAVLLRGTPIRDYHLIKQLLWVAPNFCVVWIGVGGVVTLFPLAFKREFNPAHMVWLLGSLLGILLLSEIVHALFLNASFDLWDMLASVTASAVVWGIHCHQKRKGAIP